MSDPGRRARLTQTYTDYDPTNLPVGVPIYLDAHDEKRRRRGAGVHAGRDRAWRRQDPYEGIQTVRDWMERSSTEYTYTSNPRRPAGRRRGPRGRADRIDGNSPDGTATLRYQFELQDRLIRRLAIEG